MKKLVILTGAGMSAESGISTFRDSGGLWEQYPVEQVATPEGYRANPKLVIDFYNARRKELQRVKPNRGHELIAELEKDFDVTVITQNVDNLHERAGSHHVIHLHGELTKVTSSRDPNNPAYIKELKPEEWEVKMGDLAADGSQLRPFIVWFGEAVPYRPERSHHCFGQEGACYPQGSFGRNGRIKKYVIKRTVINKSSLYLFHHIKEHYS